MPQPTLGNREPPVGRGHRISASSTQLIVAAIGAIATVAAAFVGGALAGPKIGLVIAEPTVTITANPRPSQAPPHTPVSTVYWQGGPVGITEAPGGINFDLKPATTSADAPTNISFTGTALENFYSGTTMLISQWTGIGRPTKAQCANTVLSHPSNIVNNVAEGMQICTRTIQGRVGWLTVISISPDHSTLNVKAVIWN